MIGIFGGTFDPVHFGHLRSAVELAQIFSLQQMRLLPCSQSAYKRQPTATPNQRLAMLEIAVRDTALAIDPQELAQGGVSYSVATLSKIRDANPQTPLLFFVGVDAFRGITGWHLWQDLFNYAHVVVITRPNYQLQISDSFLTKRLITDRDKLKHNGGYLFTQPVTQLDISASNIRQSIANGNAPDFLLPREVQAYINKHKLYQAAGNGWNA